MKSADALLNGFEDDHSSKERNREVEKGPTRFLS